MAVSEIGYDLALRAVLPLLRVLSPFNTKLERAVTGRARALTELRRWSESQRGEQPLLWVHAPSVGESLMAQAIIHELRVRLPEAQIAFTHFSPSAERIRQRVGANVVRAEHNRPGAPQVLRECSTDIFKICIDIQVIGLDVRHHCDCRIECQK